MNRNKIVDMLYEEIRNKSKTASDYAMCDSDIEDISNFVIDFLTEAELLLLNHAPEASAETALSANTRLGEVPAPLVEDQAIKEVAGGLGETPAVRQNEQTQTVLPHQLVLIKGKKDWFCWFCKKYEHELIGKTGGCARRAGL